jgi:hypothetical protein
VPAPPGRLRFVARPLSARPGAPYGVFRLGGDGHEPGREECLAFGPRRLCEGLAARLQDREDDLHAPGAGG